MRLQPNLIESELWVPVKGYEGLYLISKNGMVRGIDRTVRVNERTIRFQKGMVLKNNISPVGYARIALCKDGIQKFELLHRILAIHFIPNPNNYPVVNHIDGDKLNNRLDNLEWCTQKHNMAEAGRMGLIGSKGNRNRTKFKTDIDLLKLLRENNAGCSNIELSIKYGVRKETISRVLNGNRMKELIKKQQ